jgi:glycosyltransferase involved in cell wall biosynthesis
MSKQVTGKLLKTICIISNSHSTNDARLYHKLAKSLAKIATVFVLGARGVGSLMENWSEDQDLPDACTETVKPTRIIVSGLTPNLRLIGLYRQAVRLKPDLVICVEPLTMLVGLRLKRKTNCKLCYDAHEYYTSAHAERYAFPLNYIIGSLYYLFEHGLQKKMDLTMTVNDDIFRLFNLKFPETIKAEQTAGSSFKDKYLAPPAKAGVICPNYPTSAIFKEGPGACGISKLLPDTQFDTIYLGGLTEERGIIKLLQVVDLLRLKHPLFKALFVGPFHTEAFKKKFYAYLMDHNLNSNVFCRDAVPHDKVCAILKQVKVGLSVLHPGYKRYNKALPLKVLEYLSVGIPVVANDFPQLKTIIEKHQLGYCVPFHKQDIADAIEKLLLLSAAEQDTLAERSREIIRKHYLWSRIEPVLLDAVNFVLEPAKP